MSLRISLVVMAKWPQIGQTKTRLAEELGQERALAIAHAMLADTIFRLGKASIAAFDFRTDWPQRIGTAITSAPGEHRQDRQWRDRLHLAIDGSRSMPPTGLTVILRRVLAYAPEETAEQFAELAGRDFILLPQSIGDLGMRLQTLLLQEWAAGQDAVLFLGTDSPTLPLTYIGAAMAWLNRVEVVLGPAWDGGYYVLGCRWSIRWLVEPSLLQMLESHLSLSQQPVSDLRRHLPALLADYRLPIFGGIEWGSAQVFEQTVQRLEKTRLRWALLPPWYDVDTGDDWAWLTAHLRALAQAGQECGLPNLEALS